MQGIILDALGDKPAEKDSLQSALDYARRAGAKYEESLYLANLADHFLKKADYATALRYAQAALPLTRELKNLGGETVALANIGLAQIALHDIESGKRNLRASIDIDERRGSITGVSDSYAEMAQYLERAGDARGAIEALAPASRAGRADPGARPAAGHPGDAGAVRRRAPRRASWRCCSATAQIKTEALRARELEQRLGWLVAVSGALAVLRGADRRAAVCARPTGSWRTATRCCSGRPRSTRSPAWPTAAICRRRCAGWVPTAASPAPCSWPTWTTSSASTTAMATPPATPCWSRWRSACAACCATPT